MTPELIPTSYSWTLVLLSFAVSAIGAYTALAAATGIRRRGRAGVDWLNATLAGLALGGVGIWSMHFIGMVAWQIDLGVGYRLLETVVSLVAAVVVSTLALGYIASAQVTLARLLIAGSLTGIGVAVMHYLGMYSMRFYGFFDWDFGIVALSVLIAVVAATVALWLAFNTHSRVHRAGASLLMAAAVCTMHYTGMAAASVMCTTTNRRALLPDLLRPADLPVLVLLIALCVAGMIGLDMLVQRSSSREAT